MKKNINNLYMVYTQSSHNMTKSSKNNFTMMLQSLNIIQIF
jgi:hypothetical protein